MKHYTHLTQAQRYQISALKQTKISNSEIARIIGCHKSTISRELKRNTGKRGYRPKQAHQLACWRKANNSTKVTEFGWTYIKHLLAKKHSPEQITGRLKLLGFTGVPSHERIYQHIYSDKKAKGDLHTHLRCQKSYRKRHLQGQDRRGKISNRRDITERPALVEARIRLGDYEGDTVIGKAHKGVLVTLVDRTSRETKIKVLPNRKADKVAQTCVQLLVSEQTQTITFDNGKEFAHHEVIAGELGNPRHDN